MELGIGMKKLDRSLNNYPIIFQLIASIFFIMLIIIFVWTSNHKIVEISISENLSTTHISSVLPISGQLLGLILVICISVTLVMTIIIQLLNKKKIIKEINNISIEMQKNTVDTIKTEYTYSEFQSIRDAYNEKLTMINEQSKKKDEYFNMTVHDLKAPIQAVKSNMSLLKKFPTNSEIFENLSIEILHLESEVSRYLLLEKIDYFEKPDFCEIELNSFLENLIIKYALNTCNIDIKYNESLNVMADVKMLEKIFINLIQNGLQNSMNNVIKITLSLDSIIFSNKTEEQIDTVFSEKRIKSSSGNGLGTQIIQKYAEMQNIEIIENNANHEVIIKLRFRC